MKRICALVYAYALSVGAAQAGNEAINQGPLLCRAPEGVYVEFSFFDCERSWENSRITLSCPLAITKNGVRQEYVAAGEAHVVNEQPAEGPAVVEASYLGLDCWIRVPEWARRYEVHKGPMSVSGNVCVERLGVCMRFSGSLSKKKQ